MKTALVILIALVAVSGVSAFEWKSFLAGGTVSYTDSRSLPQNEPDNVFSVVPQVGYFFRPDLAARSAFSVSAAGTRMIITRQILLWGWVDEFLQELVWRAGCADRLLHFRIYLR